MKSVSNKPKVICILGMHRSGTSSISRAVNLLGFFMGDDSKLALRGADNPEGYWEHSDIVALQWRLLAQLRRHWDTAFPLPENWHLSAEIRPFRDELKNLVINNFAGQSAWAWKDPRSCLLMPLWRDVLDELQMELSCVYAVRSPVDVKNSLNKREPIPLNKAMGVWFNYCITALKDTVGVPTVFLNYDKFLTSWETEMHRVADGLKLDWPTDEAGLRATMNSFLRPDLHHNRSSEADLKSAPYHARELYELLLDASTKLAARDERFEKIVNALSADFSDYAKFYENDLNTTMKLPFIPRTLKRWRRSFRKRFPSKA